MNITSTSTIVIALASVGISFASDVTTQTLTMKGTGVACQDPNWSVRVSGDHTLNTKQMAGSASGLPVVDAPGQDGASLLDRCIGPVADGATYVATINVYTDTTGGPGGLGGSAAAFQLGSPDGTTVQYGVDNEVATLYPLPPGLRLPSIRNDTWHTFTLHYRAIAGASDEIDLFFAGAPISGGQKIKVIDDLGRPQLSRTHANTYTVFARNRGRFGVLQYDDPGWTPLAPSPRGQTASPEPAEEVQMFFSEDYTALGAEAAQWTDQWAFVCRPGYQNRSWHQTENGDITVNTAPIHRGEHAYDGQRGTNADDYLAFYKPETFGDFQVEFDFRWGSSHSGAGFIFHARDARHYYLLHFPSSGQHYRGKHFWAAISKVDQSDWVKIINMQMIQGVPSETSVWRHVRFTVQGNAFRLWVDGRPLPVVHDDTYPEPGHVGFETWTYGGQAARFRDVRITGQAHKATGWDESVKPTQNWFVPSPQYEHGEWQRHMISIVRNPQNEELLMTFNARRGMGKETPVIVRSQDNGRTWSTQRLLPDRPPFNGGIGVMIRTCDQRLIMHQGRHEDTFIAETTDGGRTWGPTKKMNADLTLPPWAAGGKAYTHSDVLELRDGTLLHFIGLHPKPAHWDIDGAKITDWGSHHSTSLSARSTDGGRTWSRPVPIDGPPSTGMHLDLTECLAVELAENEVLCLVRPIYSAWCWETRSTDGGTSWGPAVRGPFAQYANAFFRTQSGVLLHAGRYPGLGLHVSRDDGITWRSYRIGTDAWAMGRMFEVSQDLVLYVYNDAWHGASRAQFIRITEDDIEPARELLPF